MSVADKIATLGNAKTSIATAITEKGGTVADDNGFSDFASDIATIPSGGTDTRFDALIDGSLTGDVVSSATVIKSYSFMRCPITSFTDEVCVELGQQAFFECQSLTRVFTPIINKLGYACMRSTTALNSFDCVATSIDAASFYASGLTVILLRGTTVCTLANVNAFTGTPVASGNGYIYVPDNLVSSYQAATNWSTYAAQIRGLSQLPT